MYAIAKQITSRLSRTITATLLIILTSMGVCVAEETTPDLTQSIGAELDENQSAKPEESEEDRLSELLLQEQAFNQALAEASPEEQIVWLDIKYPGAASTIKSLALKIKAKAATTQGAALIVPQTSQHADWPNQVRSLRQRLPYEGWLTLSVSLPWPQLENPPKRERDVKTISEFETNDAIIRATAAGSRAQSPSNPEVEAPKEPEEEQGNEAAVDIDLKAPAEQGESIASYEERALIHVQAALDYLAQQGFQNITVIAIGESAELIIDYLRSRESEMKEKGFSLILLEPTLPNRLNTDLADALGNQFPAPILDVYRSSSIEQSAAAEERKSSARAGEFKTYQQLKLSAPLGAGTDNFLIKRISDWLNRYAPGQEKK